MTIAAKAIPLALDLGNLAVFDTNVLEPLIARAGAGSKEAVEEALLGEARRAVQELIEGMWRLPTAASDVGPLAELPEGETPLPRAMRIPEAREATRWEKFAKEKGIVKRKRGSHVFSEERQEWRPRFGRKSLKNDPTSNWISELKPGQSVPDA